MRKYRDIGISYAMVALFFNVGMDVFAKYATIGTTTWQIVFFRWFFGMLLLAVPFFLQSKNSSKSPFQRVHCIRVILNLVASYCLYHALGVLPLSTVLTIFFLEPIITIFAAAILLREQVSPLRWVAGFIGFAGVAIIAGPDTDVSELNHLYFNGDVFIAVIGASCWAVMRVLTKKYGTAISVITLSFWLSVSTTIASLPMVLITWQPIEPNIYLLLFAVAMFGIIYNYLWLKALMAISVARLANLSYVMLPFSLVVGFLLFQETPDTNFWIGSIIILFVLVVTVNKFIENAINNFCKKVFGSNKGSVD